MLEMRCYHTVANFKFYWWLSEDAKNALERGLAGLEDWQQERASGQLGAALRSVCRVRAWAGWGGQAASSCPPESCLACQGQDALCWPPHEAGLVGLLFWQPTRLSPRCSQRKHQFSELFLMRHTLFCPLSRVWASLTLLLESHLFNLFWCKKKVSKIIKALHRKPQSDQALQYSPLTHICWLHPVPRKFHAIKSDCSSLRWTGGRLYSRERMAIFTSCGMP